MLRESASCSPRGSNCKMSKQFFTLGGTCFWEDLFFYQEWRIQRNYISKKCRLLDKWDISRFEGSFEECRQTFVKYIEVYEISRQKRKMIVMIPGLGASKRVFEKMRKAALERGYGAAVINYPSTQKGSEAHLRQLEFWLTHLEDVAEVSFVTEGIGGLLLRKLFARRGEWMNKLKCGRIVEIAPMLHGCPLLARLSENRFFSFILGPMAAEMSPEDCETVPGYGDAAENAIILSESVWLTMLEKLCKQPRIRSNAEGLRQSGDVKEVMNRYSIRINSLNSSKIIKSTLDFIADGNFGA